MDRRGELTIGLVGCGRWGRHILRDLVSLGVQVTVIATRENAAHAAGNGASTVVDSLARLPRVDGYVVATPTATHAAVVDRLLQSGVPIFCEKPLCDGAGAARRLAAAGDGRLFVMDKWRYHDGVLALAQIALSGELGPVVGLRTLRVGWAQHHADVDCVWTLLPHELAIALEILGRVLPPRSAVADCAGHRVMGLIAQWGDSSGPWHVAEIGVRAPEYRRTIRLLCRDGTAGLDDAYSDHIALLHNPPVDGAAPTPQPIRRPIPVTMPLLTELRAFLGFLRGGPPPKSSAAEAVAQVEAIDAIRRLAGI